MLPRREKTDVLVSGMKQGMGYDKIALTFYALLALTNMDQAMALGIAHCRVICTGSAEGLFQERCRCKMDARSGRRVE